MTDNTQLSAEARKMVRSAITAHPKWDDYRRTHNLSLATMVRQDYIRVCAALNIDIPTISAASPSIGLAVAETVDPATAPRDHAMFLHTPDTRTQGTATMNDKLSPDQFPARGKRDEATERAKADFATADAADDFETVDATNIPAMPTAVSLTQLAKIDNLIALAVDDGISFTDTYRAARDAILCATALSSKLETALANVDPNAAKFAAITKPSLDFVPPSWARDFIDYLEIGSTVAVVGPAGNGKTTGARKLLERAGFNVYEFDCTDATLPQDLIGRTSLRQENGATVTDWIAGPVAQAFADPKGAVLLNEYDALDPRTGMALQSALEAAERRRVTAPDTGEQIKAVGDCPIVLTLNTIGHGATVEYQGRNALDGANRDRVEIIMTGYENEAQILVAHGYANETADRLAAWATVARARLAQINSREILSNRRLLTAAALIDRRSYSLADAVGKAFTCRMAERERAAFA